MSAADGTGALEKALDVLDAVGQAPAGLSQAELAERLQLPRTTVYRMLGTLTARGLLRRDPLRRVYCLGMRCFEYARSAFAMPDLVAAAGAELRALRDMTGETTYLSARDGLEIVALERAAGAHHQRSNSAPGQRKPLHCTSQGKAMLSAMPADERESLVRELPMTAVTPRSITDRRRLLAELKATEQRGWAIDDEENVLGVRCCGAAVVDAAGRVRGAISVAGPAFRLTMDRLQLLGPEVAEAARRIGAQLAPDAPAAGSGDAHPVPGDWAFDGALPVWHEGRLLWADTLAPAVHVADAQGDRVLARLDAPIGALVPVADAIAAQTPQGWLRIAADGAISPWTQGPRRSLTAACRAKDGTLWAGFADDDRWGVGPLEPDGSLRAAWRLPEPATALAWQASEQRLLVASAGSGALYAARPGHATLQRLATVPKGSGLLGGIAADDHGGVWAALRGGWSAVRFEADGSVERVLALPVPCPTAVAFGGGRLWITSARESVSREALDAAPWSGRLFVA